MISPEDESAFSAVFDGDLHPLERRAVESALAARSPPFGPGPGPSDLARPRVRSLPSGGARRLLRSSSSESRAVWFVAGRGESIRRGLPWLAVALARSGGRSPGVVGAFQHRYPAPRSRSAKQNHRYKAPRDTDLKPESKTEVHLRARRTCHTSTPPGLHLSRQAAQNPGRPADSASRLTLQPGRSA